MSVRNDLITELESLVGAHVDVKGLSNDQLKEAVGKARAEKEAADEAAAAEAAQRGAADSEGKRAQSEVQDSPEIPKGYKFKYPLQVAPGIGIHCRRGLLKPGDEVKPGDGEIAKLVARGKVLTGPGFEESMLHQPLAARPMLKPPPRPGARRK